VSFLLQCMLVPDGAGGVPVFPDAVELLSSLFKAEVARRGGRVDSAMGPNHPQDDGTLTAVERACFDDADSALMAALEIMQAVHSESRRPRVPMPIRTSLDRDDLLHDVVWHDRYATCTTLCRAGSTGQVLATESFAHGVTAAVEPAGLGALEATRLDDLSPSRRLYQLEHPDLAGAFPPLRTLNDVPNNLPVQQTHFVGRVRELRAVRLMLKLYRMVTIIGGGGIGKTRLALQAAAYDLERFPDGIWLVELASARHATQVAAEIAAAIGLEDMGGDPQQLIKERLALGRCLIILDNCEFDPLAAATVAEQLVAACPGLHVLAASRRALECASEQPFVLSPMAMAMADDGLAPHGPPSDAGRLFIDRVMARSRRVPLDADDRVLAERLCVLLDGNPLAVELAAARLGDWDLVTLYDRIVQRFDALGENPSAQHPRQRSLWATIDWSFQLLSSGAQRLFEEFSVFDGGADGDAIQRVAGPEVAGIDPRTALDELTRVFLLDRQDTLDPPRWTMLSTIRAFASERLVVRGDAMPIRARHAEWYSEVAAQSTEIINGPEQADVVRRLALEHRNLRAALEWYEAQADPEGGLRMSVALRRYWACAGHFGEGRQHLEALLLRSEGVDERLRADALHSLATLSSRQSDFARARECLDEALLIAERQSDGHLEGKVRNAFGQLAMLTGDVTSARQQFAAALARMQELEHEVGIIAALNNLAMAETTLGNLAAAAGYFETCLGLAREIGYARGIADALNNLGMVLGMRSDYRRTRSVLAECVSILQQIGERRRLALAMGNLAHAALRQGRPGDARQLCLEALAIQEAIGDRSGAAQTRLGLGRTSLFQDDVDEAAGQFELALGMMRSLDERNADEAEVLVGLGDIARRRGDLRTATAYLSESLDLSGDSGDLRHRALAKIALGRTRIDVGQPNAARVDLVDGLALFARLGNRRGMVEAVEILGSLAPASEAVAMLEAAAAERIRLGAPLPPHEADALGSFQSDLVAVLGEAARDAARREGAEHDLDSLVGRLLADVAEARAPDPPRA